MEKIIELWALLCTYSLVILCHLKFNRKQQHTFFAGYIIECFGYQFKVSASLHGKNFLYLTFRTAWIFNPMRTFLAIISKSSTTPMVLTTVKYSSKPATHYILIASDVKITGALECFDGLRSQFACAQKCTSIWPTCAGFQYIFGGKLECCLFDSSAISNGNRQQVSGCRVWKAIPDDAAWISPYVWIWIDYSGLNYICRRIACLLCFDVRDKT